MFEKEKKRKEIEKKPKTKPMNQPSPARPHLPSLLSPWPTFFFFPAQPRQTNLAAHFLSPRPSSPSAHPPFPSRVARFPSPAPSSAQRQRQRPRQRRGPALRAPLPLFWPVTPSPARLAHLSPRASPRFTPRRFLWLTGRSHRSVPLASARSRAAAPTSAR